MNGKNYYVVFVLRILLFFTKTGSVCGHNSWQGCEFVSWVWFGFLNKFEDHASESMSIGFNRYALGFRRPEASGKVQTVQQMMAFRAIIEGKQHQQEGEEKSTNIGVGSPVKTGMPEGAARISSSGPASQQDAAGPSSISGVRNVLLPPRYSLVDQEALTGEDVSAVARQPDPTIHTVDVNLSLSIPSSRQQFPEHSSGVGPLCPTTLLRVPRLPDHSHRLSSIQVVPGSGAQVGIAARSRPASQYHLPGRPPSAQLTIFYSGMVNVYDNVPADKAQAIMLLAGSGSSWSSNSISPPASVPARPPSAAAGTASPSNAPVPQSTTTLSASPGLPVLQLAPVVSIAGGLKGRPPIPVHAELPQARKASLFRFLEKRKDRVRGAAPYGTSMFGPRKPSGDRPLSPAREVSPSLNMGKMFVGSPSLGNAGPRKRSSSPASRTGPPQPSGNACETSPSRCPATPKHTCQAGSSWGQASGPSVLQRSIKEHTKRGTKQCQAATQEQEQWVHVSGPSVLLRPSKEEHTETRTQQCHSATQQLEPAVEEMSSPPGRE